MLNLDPAKLLIIAVVAIILLGPDKLPGVARQVGAAWRSFTEFRHRMETEVRNSIPDLPSSTDIARLARSPSALLDHLSNLSLDGLSKPTNGTGESTNGTVTSAGPAGDESTVTDETVAPPSTMAPSTSMPPSTSPPNTGPMPGRAGGHPFGAAAPGDPGLN